MTALFIFRPPLSLVPSTCPFFFAALLSTAHNLFAPLRQVGVLPLTFPTYVLHVYIYGFSPLNYDVIFLVSILHNRSPSRASGFQAQLEILFPPYFRLSRAVFPQSALERYQRLYEVIKTYRNK